MTTLTYVKGLPTQNDELTPIGYTSFEMFLTSYSVIFHKAACETVNYLLSGFDFDKGAWNSYLQRTYGINKRHANGVIQFGIGAYESEDRMSREPSFRSHRKAKICPKMGIFKIETTERRSEVLWQKELDKK